MEAVDKPVALGDVVKQMSSDYIRRTRCRYCSQSERSDEIFELPLCES